jgi:hypothetical protein
MPVVSMRAQAEVLPSSDTVVIRWHSWPYAKNRCTASSGAPERLLTNLAIVRSLLRKAAPISGTSATDSAWTCSIRRSRFEIKVAYAAPIADSTPSGVWSALVSAPSLRVE